ncbi:MAG: DUF5671 domain-containing protein [Patescibacteria group bacterium]|nr:DUF5671 domain-containing protein [Patescibacteria group bacterium]
MTDSKKTGPKEVFGHLLAIIGLYVSVISFGALLFGLVNIYFPDVLNFRYGRFAERSLKWPLAVLVVVFPLYLWLTAYLQKDLEKNPEKKELKIRKWLLYLTLFITSIVIVVDLITLVFRFLGGDLTIQFILKVLAVFAIALAVFVYYLWNIRKDIPASKHSKMKWFVRGVIVLGAIFIVFGFFKAGSPFAERVRRFDERRVQNLQSIQRELINYWQAKESLPQNLSGLRDDIRGFVPPRDPETGEAYSYSVLGDKQFELCATFKTSNEGLETIEGKPLPAPRGVRSPVPVLISESWLHSVGEECFRRTIDPDLYPTIKER